MRLKIEMQTLPTVATCMLMISLVTAGCANKMIGGLTVTGGDLINYRCETGQLITVKYYSLSDGSLNFVKITMPDGHEHTLPQVVSASGVRYSDDLNFVWWTKGSTAFFQTRDEDGKWQMMCRDCREITESKGRRTK